jgi:hypothetical protein
VARRSEQLEVTIDGQPGRIWEGCPKEIEATVVAEGACTSSPLFSDSQVNVSRPAFDAYASTIDLTPETAPAPSSSAAP